MFLTALFLTGSAALALAADYPVDHESYPMPRDRRVHVDFPVGDLRVETTSGDRIEFDLRAKCNRWDCDDRMSKIYIDAIDDGSQLRLKVKGYPRSCSHLSLTGVLRIPQDHGLGVQMGVGNLDVDGLTGDVDVDLGVGDARIHTAESAVGSVSAQAGVGDADVRTSSGRVRHRGFVGSSASWDGSGRASVNVRVGVGDANVKVD